jgi:transposase InsO family protein
VRDAVVDYVGYWTARTELPAERLVGWIGLGRSKYHTWRSRYGKVNEHNAQVPRDHWLENWEKQAIKAYRCQNPCEGYRRLTYMMMDADIVAASPASVYRVLKEAGLMESWNRKPSRKGTGFHQPVGAHEHWHVDVSYINVCGTFYYLCSILDGFSRYIVHWEIREAMKARDIEIILQRGREAFPGVQPRIISDNGPQFIAKDFKEFIRVSGMTHVRTSPYYPQSNGKIERWHKSLKNECVRQQVPSTLDDARRAVAGFVTQYNTKRLHSAIGYVTPQDKLEGRARTIHAERDRKLAAAREARRRRRQARRLSCASESGSTHTDGLESPWSSVASASPHPALGGGEATGRKGRPPAVPEPRPSTPAGGKDNDQASRPRRGGDLLNTMGGLSNSR